MHLRRNRRPLKHLGTFHGSGRLTNPGGEHTFGSVSYEIDGYFDEVTRSGNGRIEGSASTLSQAFHAGSARITLEDGQLLDIVLNDPMGDVVAEIAVSGRLPEMSRELTDARTARSSPLILRRFETSCGMIAERSEIPPRAAETRE